MARNYVVTILLFCSVLFLNSYCFKETNSRNLNVSGQVFVNNKLVNGGKVSLRSIEFGGKSESDVYKNGNINNNGSFNVTTALNNADLEKQLSEAFSIIGEVQALAVEKPSKSLDVMERLRKMELVLTFKINVPSEMIFNKAFTFRKNASELPKQEPLDSEWKIDIGEIALTK